MSARPKLLFRILPALPIAALAIGAVFATSLTPPETTDQRRDFESLVTAASLGLFGGGAPAATPVALSEPVTQEQTQRGLEQLSKISQDMRVMPAQAGKKLASKVEGLVEDGDVDLSGVPRRALVWDLASVKHYRDIRIVHVPATRDTLQDLSSVTFTLSGGRDEVTTVTEILLTPMSDVEQRLRAWTDGTSIADKVLNARLETVTDTEAYTPAAAESVPVRRAASTTPMGAAAAPAMRFSGPATTDGARASSGAGASVSESSGAVVVQAGFSWSRLNRCLSSAGIGWFVVTTISIICSVTCIATLGLACAVCIAAAAGTTTTIAAMCIRYART